MTVKPLAVTALEIREAPGFDFIRIVLSDEAIGRGSIIIYSDSGTYATSWGAMGAEDVRQFVCNVDTDYLVQRLQDPYRNHYPKGEIYRMTRMVNFVKEALTNQPQ